MFITVTPHCGTELILVKIKSDTNDSSQRERLYPIQTRNEAVNFDVPFCPRARPRTDVNRDV